jgi:hypothetical protein
MKEYFIEIYHACKYKLSGKCKDSNLKQMKANIQKEQRTAYWHYIEKMICNIPVDMTKHQHPQSFQKIYFISYPWKVLSMFKHFLRDVFCH